MKPLSLLSSALALRLADAYLVAPPGTEAPGATSSCSGWVQQSYGLTCAIIEQFYGMTAAQFESWNPTVTELGDGCNMISGLYYCVQVNYVSMSFLSTGPPTMTTSTTPTTTGGGGTTPSPTQSGLVGNCNKFYKVVSGDGCYDIAAAAGVALADFYSWNPAVGTDCSHLFPDYYVCVGVSSSGPTTTTTTTTTTTPGNGITTPTPIQTGMTANCNKFYDVVSGDGCYDIAAAAGVALADFYSWNPAVGSNCATLFPGYYVCVGVKGSPTTTSKPTTTKPGNGVVTPTPYQANMITSCKTFHFVVSGDGCYDIAAAAGIPLASFYSWNPAVGSTCATLQAGYYVCIAIL